MGCTVECMKVSTMMDLIGSAEVSTITTMEDFITTVEERTILVTKFHKGSEDITKSVTTSITKSIIVIILTIGTNVQDMKIEGTEI
jgi:hypothetical protein